MHTIERLSIYDRYRYEEILKSHLQAQKIKSKIDYIQFNFTLNSSNQLNKQRVTEVTHEFHHLISEAELDFHRSILFEQY